MDLTETQDNKSYFVNQKLLAPNVLEIDVEPGCLDKFSQLIQNPFNEKDYFISSPNWNSDIKWISTNSLDAYRFFLDSFEKMAIAKHVTNLLDLNHKPTLYEGFIVSRSLCTETNFHEDWISTKNQAFTFITPITNNADGFGLLYYDIHGQIREYNYSVGKGILFGDNFVHSTKPGSTKDPVMLLCFTFGTDKMEYWDAISKTASYQSNLVRLPNGQFIVKNIN